MIYRRPFIRAFRALYDEARRDLAQLSFEHQCAIADLKRELAETRADFEELKDVVRRRVAAEAELAALRRERELVEAWTAERDLSQPLQ